MRILITVNTAFNVANFRAGLVRALVADGHEVTALVPEDEDVPRIEALGARVVHLPMDRKGLSAWNDLQLIRRFTAEFRRLKPDVVLSFTIKNNIYGALSARRLGVPFLPNVTGLGTAFLGHPLLTALVTRLYRAAFGPLPVVFFQNADDKALFVDKRIVRPDQGRLLPGSGIDLSAFAPAPLPSRGGGATFLMIGRVLRDKGVLEYVEAARIVKRQVPGARFQLLGATGYENRTAFDRDTVAAWEAEGAIEYLGTMPDVRPAITASDCVVLPSYREGTPRTLLEAAAMARPLIATDVPGCRQVVDDGTTGFLCTVRSAESLADACLQFLALEPAERARLGQAGREKVTSEFDERIVIEAYRETIAELVDG